MFAILEKKQIHRILQQQNSWKGTRNLRILLSFWPGRLQCLYFINGRLYIAYLSWVFCFRWVLSKAKKDDTDDEIAKYDGEWPVL